MASSATGFWERVDLKEEEMVVCVQAVRRRYSEYNVEEFDCQGYCSFTLLLSLRKEHTVNEDGIKSDGSVLASGFFGQLIVQLRPAQHALNLDIASAASKAYSPLAPTTQAVDLHLPGDLRAYEMSRLEGTPMSRLLTREFSTRAGIRERQEILIASFARVVAQGWPDTKSRNRRDSILRPDLPLSDQQTMLSQCTGKVGSCIVRKLEKLAEDLPDLWLQQRARSTVARLRVVEDYPIVLNHGDLIPSNILVNEDTWEITGLVDWAEAEYLPFGTCLYGLEHLLGILSSAEQLSPSATENLEPHCDGIRVKVPMFAYFYNATELRNLFWKHLIKLVPEIGSRQEEVRLMRDVGVFLWHGYAWDEGAIDRVVNEASDMEELTKLRAFLSVL
jgi:hypothetical protein